MLREDVLVQHSLQDGNTHLEPHEPVDDPAQHRSQGDDRYYREFQFGCIRLAHGEDLPRNR